MTRKKVVEMEYFWAALEKFTIFKTIFSVFAFKQSNAKQTTKQNRQTARITQTERQKKNRLKFA